MNKQRTSYLHQQYIHNQMSVSELEEWKTIVANVDIKPVMDEHWISLREEQYLNLASPKADRLFRIVIKARPVKKTIYWKWAAAASAVIMVTCSLWLFNAKDDRQYISPGKNTATVTLPNGKTIALSDSRSGLVINAGKLLYIDGTTVGATGDLIDKHDENEALTISTPKGGTYEVILSDGTHVWLNADSKLEFPAHFENEQRGVKLSGEGYFEVAKVWNKKRGTKGVPFLVTSGTQTVEVLGTHFNVDAYENDNVIKTTLLEGSIRVSDHGTGKLLSPGFQARNTRNQLVITKVDVNIAVAWKNKQFVFQHENIQSIMKKVERWYDVDVVYETEASNETFSGGVSRFDYLGEVLKSLELTGKVSFKVKGKTVYVYCK